MAKYDIHNPTRAARVIYDGLEKPRQIYIASGESRHGIELSDDIADELIDRTRKPQDHDSDLKLTRLPDDEPVKQPEPERHPDKNDGTGKVNDPTMRQTKK